ncbi:MAG: type II toxin-antitoxin system RelE/ParE family toxin [Tannerellaceae bacterium]|nr:type II toxin-antitoxin system RelE/ParE family toxin [Tannerellaceae bacterium]
MKIIISPEALTEIKTIYNYYSLYNEKYAIKICSTIFDYISLLSAFPQMGNIEPLLIENPRKYRCLTVSKCKCKIIYKIEDTIIWIATVWDCRQDPAKLSQHIR